MTRLNKLIIIVLLLSCTDLYAQNVAINNSGALPDASAMLDVYSLEKGFLPPRMRTLQRTSILSPADGLMVYDTDTDSYWVRRPSPFGWAEIVHSKNALWSQSIYGPIVNTDQKHVAISNTSSTGLSSDGVLNLYREEATTNDVVDILAIQRATSGTAQSGIGASILFRNELSNHAFGPSGRITTLNEISTLGASKTAMNFQVYGPNSLININDLYFNMEGLTIGANTPAASMLDVKGTISLTDEINNPTKTGTANLLPISYGNVQGNGTINTGSGNFSVNRTGVGTYYITITSHTFHYLTYLATVTPAFINVPRIAVTSSFSGDLIIRVFDISGTLVDGNFNFVVHKP